MRSFLLLALLLASSSALAADRCVERLAALDVGSSATKLEVADVDVCRHVVVAEVLRDSTFVPYKQDLARSGASRFGREIVAQGRAVISDLVARAARAGAVRVAGVATAAFRSAANADELLAPLAPKLPIRVISQEEEARLGYVAGAARAGPQAAGAPGPVVWDIGGGSMQITLRSADGTLSAFQGTLASIGFAERVIREIQGRAPASTPSPNPLGADWAAAVRLAQSIADRDLPEPLRRELVAGERQVVGIGGVWGAGIRAQVGGDRASQADLEAALQRAAQLTDGELGGAHAATEATNLALALGFMRSLGVREIRLAQVTLADAILVDPAYFPAPEEPRRDVAGRAASPRGPGAAARTRADRPRPASTESAAGP